MRKYTLLIISTFLALFVSCERQEAEKQYPVDIQKLDSLRVASNKAMGFEILAPARELEKEADRQNNDLYKAIAYYQLCRYYLICEGQEVINKEFISDSILIYAQKAKDYYQKIEDKEGPIHVEELLLLREIQAGTPKEPLIGRLLELVEKTKQTENKMLIYKVYHLLGQAYIALNLPREAMDVFHLQLETLREMDATPNNPIFKEQSYVIVFNLLAHTATHLPDTNLTLIYSDSIRYYAQKLSGPFAIEANIGADVYSLDAYIEKGDLIQAKSLADNLEAFCNTTLPEERNTTYFSVKNTLSQYYLYKKEYTKALQTINEVLNYSIFSDNRPNQMMAQRVKTKILARLGNINEAFRLESQVLAYTDSLSRENSTRQFSEMQTIYNVSQLEKQNLEKQVEIEEEKAKTQKWILVVISLALSLIIFVVLRIKDRELRKKNRILFEQYKQSISNLQKEPKKDEIRRLEVTKEPSLFDKLKQYLSESRTFEDADIDREVLAAQLGTNREYLIRSIQENTGMTFTEFINNYRLEHVRELLYNDKDSSIKSIYLSAGFDSAGNFYHSFKQKYGMTPKEFRDIAMQENTKKQ